jgi:hypothetical protein
MKMNLLDMVTDIMSDMDSDLVSSIGDSEESLQVARIIKSTYYEMMARKDWPHLRRTLALENSDDDLLPTRLKLPINVSRMQYLSYSQKKLEDDDQTFKEVKYLYPDEFITKANNKNISDETTDSIVVDGIQMFITNDKPPEYYTSFDDEWVIFDSWVSTLTDTLIGEESQCVAYVTPTWSEVDAFIPDLPTEAFPTFLAEAKSTSFARIKQQQDAKSEQQATRGNTLMAQRGWKVQGGVRYPNYGRSSRKYGSGTHFNPRQYTGGK